MNRRRLGAQGLEVSEQGLGCMGMSAVYGQPDDEESKATLHRALELGIDFFDTADVYARGVNERLVGSTLRENRDEIVLATKFGLAMSDEEEERAPRGDAAYVRQACEASLERLGTDHIDLYYQHRLDRTVPIEETVGAMAELVAEGKVRYLGLSEAGGETLRRANAVHPISALQSEYSIWERGLEADVFPTLRELGIGLVPFSPLGRGLLTAKLEAGDIGADDARRTRFPRLSPEHFDANRRLVAGLEELAGQKGVAPGQLSLAWVLAQGEDIVPIPGTKRRTYLEENAGASEVRLDADDLRRLDDLFPPGVAVGPRYTPEGMATVDR